MGIWNEMELGSAITLQRGFDLPNRLRKPGVIPIVSSAGPYDYHNVAQVSGPGVVTGRYGTIGEVFFVEEDFWPLNTTLFVKEFNGNDPLYISYLLRTIDFEPHSGKSGVPGINRNDIHALRINIPPKEEQTAIANALSDVDVLITSLEKLIAKKRAIKTAAMQQLLTGKKRLPPFDQMHTGYKQTELGEIPEDWEVALLGDAVDFLDGLRRPVKSKDRVKMRGTYRYYGASGIVDYVNGYLFDGSYILLGEDGENILSRNLPLAFKVEGKFWVNNHAHVMQVKNNFNIDYLTGFLESLDYSLLNSGTAQPKLNKQSCLTIKVAKPSLSEQRSIADFLFDMDKEIGVLVKRLDKTQQLKQGMMQELLTGRTRLL